MDQPKAPPSAGNLQEWLKWAETKISLSLAVTLYMKPPASSFADGMLECYEEYLGVCESHLAWYASEHHGFRAATANVLRIPFRRLPEAIGHGVDWGWCASGGEHHRDASPYQFTAVASKSAYYLNPLRAAFPVEMFSGDLGRFLALVKRFASRMPFFFGYAGLSFSTSLEPGTAQQNEQYLLPVAMRFSGVEVEDRSSTSICCTESIKGTSWLTLLSPGFVEKLGGKPALGERFGEAIKLHDLPTGLLIQAGPAPELGDVNAGERLPLYREVHRALTPIRNPSHYMMGARAFGKEETRRWMRRFDD